MPTEQEASKKVSIEEIARALGVSKTTVSRALSGKGRISQATRVRVQEYLTNAGAAPAVRTTPQVHTTHNLTMVIPSHFVHLDLPFLRKSMGASARRQPSGGTTCCFATLRGQTPASWNASSPTTKWTG